MYVKTFLGSPLIVLLLHEMICSNTRNRIPAYLKNLFRLNFLVINVIIMITIIIITMKIGDIAFVLILKWYLRKVGWTRARGDKNFPHDLLWFVLLLIEKIQVNFLNPYGW